MLGPQPSYVLAGPPNRRRPPDPFGQHGGRHIRHLAQQCPHRWLEGGERRRRRSPLILRGASDFTALMTVVREIPNRSAIRDFGTPSAASLLINAQSSKVITLQSLSVHFSPPKPFSFGAPSTT